MRLANLKQKIKDARNECYSKQKRTDKRILVSEEVKLNNKISFFAVNSGFDIILYMSKTEKKWRLFFEQLDMWVKKEFKINGDFQLSNSKDYGIKKNLNNSYMHMYMMHNESKN